MRFIRLVVGLSITLALLMGSVAMAVEANDDVNLVAKFWNEPDSAVIASVNGQDITKGDLLKMLWEWSAPGALEELINQTLIKQAADAAGVEVKEDEFESKLQEQVQRIPGIEGGDWKTALRRHNMTETRFRQSIMMSILAEKTVERDVRVTEDSFADWAKARHILIRPNAQETDKEKADADAKARAEQVLAGLKEGQSFEELAGIHSDDVTNKDQGGALGWFKKGRMVQEFEEAVFGSEDVQGLKPGQITETPVKTMFGYHIIELQGLGSDANEEERVKLRDMILQEEIPTKMSDWYNNLRTTANIQNHINPPLPSLPNQLD